MALTKEQMWAKADNAAAKSAETLNGMYSTSSREGYALEARGWIEVANYWRKRAEKA